MKLLKFLFLSSVLNLSFALGHEGDLVLEGERWISKFNGYVCDESGESVATPSSFTELNVTFEKLTTDRSLDNVLIKGSFKQDGAVCRYSALLFADNDIKTFSFVESRAFAVAGASDCSFGKRILDDSFQFGDYLYYGHPHNVALMASVRGALNVCGGDTVGVNFVVSGRVQN